ncbi:MAG: winged helix-turn-helix domain-containing protein [Promethearchaeota archaeon]
MSTTESSRKSIHEKNATGSPNMPNSPKNPNTTNSTEESTILKPKYTMNDIFHNDIRSRMWGLFSMYPELTLADLSKYLKKSKSTIHPHLKILKEMELIEEVREEKVRGAIKSKIYSLKKGYQEKFANWGLQKNCKKEHIDTEMGIRITENAANWIQIQIDNLIMQKKFYQELQEILNTPYQDEALEILNRIYGLEQKKSGTQIFTKKTLKAFGYFDEGSYQKLRELFGKFFNEIAEISNKAEENDPTIEKPYYFLMNVIPMKEVYDFLFRKKT